MWYCVLKIADYRLQYLGRDYREAEAANVEGMHLAEAERLGDAQRNAAIEVGRIRAGKMQANRRTKE